MEGHCLFRKIDHVELTGWQIVERKFDHRRSERSFLWHFENTRTSAYRLPRKSSSLTQPSVHIRSESLIISCFQIMSMRIYRQQAPSSSGSPLIKSLAARWAPAPLSLFSFVSIKYINRFMSLVQLVSSHYSQAVLSFFCLLMSFYSTLPSMCFPAVIRRKAFSYISFPAE